MDFKDYLVARLQQPADANPLFNYILKRVNERKGIKGTIEEKMKKGKFQLSKASFNYANFALSADIEIVPPSILKWNPPLGF